MYVVIMNFLFCSTTLMTVDLCDRDPTSPISSGEGSDDSDEELPVQPMDVAQSVVDQTLNDSASEETDVSR